MGIKQKKNSDKNKYGKVFPEPQNDQESYEFDDDSYFRKLSMLI